MRDSLTWQRTPATKPALPGPLRALTRGARLIPAHPGTNAAELAATTQAADQMTAPPESQPADAQAAAVSVVTLLAHGTAPATHLFEELAGEPVRIHLTGSRSRPLTPAECLELAVSPGTYGHQRDGTLRTATTGLVAAEVFSLLIPDRLPAAARRALGLPGPDAPAPPASTIPLGKVLADLGVRREPLGACLVPGTATPSGGHILLESSARMWLADVPVALASERVTTEFCQHCARWLAPAPGTVIAGLKAS